MKYLIIGTIIVIVGIGVMKYYNQVLGMTTVLIGVAVGIKGRDKLDNKQS
jgi:hypothetical protein